ncbi:PAS domain S-box protein [Polynucleobacter paneuropaeus]|nr:PAS domain S-box protein [Polynucleobacter paneuropaeus]
MSEKFRAGQAAIERLAAIVSSSDDAIIAKDLNGVITSSNQGAERIYGYKAEEVVGKKIDFLLPPGHLEEETGYLNQILRGEKIEHFAIERIRKDGRHITVSTNVSPILDAECKVIGISRIGRDITEQQKAYEALIVGNKELLFQQQEKAKRAAELVIANEEKAKRVDELFTANEEKAKRVDELVIANKELQFQNEEKAKRAEEVLVAHEEKLKLEVLNAEKLRLSLMDTIGIARELVGLRDRYTSDHEKHVGDLAKAIAGQMGLDEKTQTGLMIAGYLHDIGKIIIPEAILCKPGKLSIAEYNLIKDHVQACYDLLKNVSFPWSISQSILEHHERLDGSGYPNQLKAEQISIEGRIMAVADVVDAMSAYRPYRPSLGIDVALSEIERGRGSLYDESAVDACLALFREQKYKISTLQSS